MTAQNNTVAIAFMVIATAFIAATTLLAKALGTDTLGPSLPPLMVTFGRFAFAWTLIASVLLVVRPKLSKPHFPLHLARTACGSSGVTMMFAAAAMIPLADATAISFLNPIFGMLFAMVFLKERIGPWRAFAAAVAFGGALILARPTGTVEIGVFFALGAALALGLELIFIKQLSGREIPLQVLFVNNSLGLMIATFAALAIWQMPTPAQWAAMVALGFLMACAQFCFVNAMARAEASYITPFSYLTLVFATVYDGALFGVWPVATTVIGAALILTSAAILAWREGRLKA